MRRGATKYVAACCRRGRRQFIVLSPGRWFFGKAGREDAIAGNDGNLAWQKVVELARNKILQSAKWYQPIPMRHQQIDVEGESCGALKCHRLDRNDPVDGKISARSAASRKRTTVAIWSVKYKSKTPVRKKSVTRYLSWIVGGFCAS